MTEPIRAALVLALVIVGAFVAYTFFLQPFMAVQPSVRGVISANSTWSVSMQEYDKDGPLAEQTYRISNDNGKTTEFFAATNRAGTVTKEFTAPIVGPQGTFLFEELRADGLWELEDRPMRPHAVDEYVIEVDQTLGDEGGTRSFGFSDPAFWAYTHAREYQLKLPLHGPIAGSGSPTLGVAGRSLQDPRYLKIVTLIRAFGPPAVHAAQARIRAELAYTAQHPIAPR